jgi:LPXTG-site transpeptidase (sortase) family protein
MRRRFFTVLRLCIFTMLLAGLLFPSQFSVHAAPTLTIAPLTWNIIGLDSNDPVSGPSLFPVGVRVCSAGATTSTVKFVWDDGNNAYNGDTYINLRSSPSDSASSITLSFTAAGCQDAYFEVQVTKVAGAYNKTRRYHITAENPGGADLVSTPTPRELYVEHLISQNRNGITDVRLNAVSIPAGGTMNLLVGNIYTIDLVGGTATQGYNQFESFINFPNTIFQIISKTANTPDGVLTDYAANSSPYISGGTQPVIDYRGLYADACLWDNDPGSPNYRSCIGGDGKTGGAPVTTSYMIKVIGGAGTTQTLNSLLYDFSGSSYHYNSDAGIGIRFARIIGPSSVTVQKSFLPRVIAPSGTSTMTIRLSNPTTENLTGVHFDDAFPATPAAMTVAAPLSSSNTCGGTLQDNLGGSLGAGDAGIRLINGTLAANSSCTITVSVTVPPAPANGDYDNKTADLFINLGGTDTDTTQFGEDILKVASAPACTPGQSIAQWIFPAGFSVNSPVPSTGTATASPGIGLTPTDFAEGTDAWGSNGNITTGTTLVLANDEYLEFALNTSLYSSVNFTFDAARKNNANSPTGLAIYYSNSSGNGAGTEPNAALYNSATALPTGATGFTGFGPFTITPSGATTYVRIYLFNSGNINPGSDEFVDNVTFTGCKLPSPAPTITKTFRNAAGTADVSFILRGSTSVLRFTISNTASGSQALTGISFTDTLPLGLDVASPGSAQCGGTLTVTNNTSPTRDRISLSGGTLAAGTSCTFDVNVTGTVAGQYENVSGYLSSTESGATTNFAQDTLDVIAPPTLAKTFNAGSILTGGTSTLSFILTNPNNLTSLSGIGFSDKLPGGVTVITSAPSVTCGGILSTTAPDTISFSGGNLAANTSCNFNVTVTGATAGTKVNTTSTVTSNEGGSESAATATLEVKTPVAIIGLNKQISTDNSNWFKSVGIAPPQDVWYRFTITNDGEAELSGISVVDPGLTMCTMPAQLAVGATASCVVGPISVTDAPSPNPFVNTATASTNETTPVTSTARYGTQLLAIVKNVTETYFAAEGDLLHYSYTVTNNGGYPLLGPVTVTDDKVGIVACQDPRTVGNTNDYLDPGEKVTCPVTGTSTYRVQASDVAARQVTNSAFGTASGVDSSPASKTVPLAPDFSVAKINSITGDNNPGTVTLSSGSFDWILSVANSASAGAAAFTDGQTILTDTLPTAGATYTVGTITYTGMTGTVVCSITGATFTLGCTASGAVSMPAGASFNVPVTVTPTSTGTFVNPKAVGSCQVDPAGLIPETDETNNNCNANTVTVIAPPVATISVSPTSVTEDGTTNLVYTLTLDKVPLVDTTINLSTTGTATGTDYTGSVTSVIIPAGSTTATIIIDPTPDTDVELDETVIIAIDPGSGYTVGTPSSATGTITTDDLPVATITVSPALVAEDGGTNLLYTVTLDKAAAVDTTISLITTGSASGTDYSGAVASVTISAGSSTATVTIDPTPDNTVEPDETVILTISTGTGYSIGIPSAATGTITDNDIPTATITVLPASVVEDGATNLVYTVTVDQAPLVDTTINLSTTGTAGDGVDYSGSVTSVIIPAGLTTATVTIDPVADTFTEPDETVIIAIDPGTGYAVGNPSSATGTILDDDTPAEPVAMISVSPSAVTEDGVASLVYTVTLDKARLVDTVTNLTTTGTATGSDYTGSVTSVTIPAGSTTATVTIDPTPDATVEADETVIITITPGTGYTVGTSSSATGTISDDDIPIATITVLPASVAENGATSLVYTVTLDKTPLVDTTINLSTTGNASGNDYTGSVASVTIPAGSTAATVTIDPVPDAVVESDETVIITVYPGTGYTVGSPSSATGTITNDDLPVATIAVSPASVMEDGAANLVYTVTMDNTPLVDTTINLSTTGTTSGTDYTGSVISVTIQAGSTTATVTIDPTPDTTFEPDETVIITIDPGSGYTVGTSSTATGTITNDDSTPISMIGIAKHVVSKTEVSPGTWDVTYVFYVENYGTVELGLLQVVDDLSVTFPLPTTFSVRNIASTQFTENIVYDGSSDTNLLTGDDSLAPGASGTITLVVRIVPANGGLFENVATVSGMGPNEDMITDDSQDGTNPDPDGNEDPTNNNDPSTLTFGPNLFDPPFGVKTYDASGLPVLKWTMTWINNSNVVAVNAQVSDPIVTGTAYAGGLACSVSGVSTTTICHFESASVTYPQGRVVWSGSIGPDLGATSVTLAANEVTISFNVTINSGTNSVQNFATVDSDRNGDNDYTDPGEPGDASASRTWNGQTQSGAKSGRLPATGFAPGVVTSLSHVPYENYLATGDVSLEIPSLGIKIPVVGVPKKDGTWNVSWLANQAGWLEGSAFPSWNGNSVLTGHVYLASGLPGPFLNLNDLKYGDRIVIHAYGQQYTFAVQINELVDPSDVSVMKHEEKPWLTLITCKDYDEKTGSYRKRVAVRAVLVRVDVDRSQ